MPAAREYSDQLRQRAVRMVLDRRSEAGDQLEAIKRVADQLSVAPQILQQIGRASCRERV